ncbi:MAG: MBL fold metallo-hydrolase [Betaproteobacteria bacterium]|nr:MBL fold metallo-hydrolase [Betaproteobacteria bacterium]
MPQQIRVLERGWLSANNIVFHEGAEATLVDSGYLTHAGQTLALVAQALEGRRLVRLINTHSHSDHIGGNAAVRRAHGCRILVPEGMAPAVEDWDEDALLLSSAHQQAEPFAFDATIAPGDELEMGGIRWRALHVPGHDMHALAYHAPRERILISGDALWRDGFGVMFAELHGDPSGLPAQRRTLEMLRELDVGVVIPGHGAPFADYADAVDRALVRLAAFEQSPERMAKSAMKALFTFTLLEKRRMPRATIGEHFSQVAIFRDVSRNFFHKEPAAVAAQVIDELLGAGVLMEQDGDIVARGG